MPIIYNKLFHILIDRGIKKGELQKKANITASIMARLAKNEPVKMDTIDLRGLTMSTRRRITICKNNGIKKF